MATFKSIQQRAARSIANIYFDSASFMPRVGNAISLCDATLISEEELQPAGYDGVSNIKQDVIVYRKEQIADSVMEPGGYFTIDGVKYIVEAVSPNDGVIFGHVIVRNEDKS